VGTSLSTAIVVFAKAPVAGQVKRRLIPAIGAEAACRLYEHMIVHEVANAVNAAVDEVQLWCAPDSGHALFQSLQQRFPVTLHQQQGQDLGSRMHYAFDQALRDFERVLLVGTDCPFLTTSILNRSLNILNAPDSAVIVPSHDGGYVLLGLMRNDRRLFEDIPWSTARVYQDTVTRLDRCHYQWQAMETLHDIDRYDDLLYLKATAGEAGLNRETVDFLGEVLASG